jgi:hypothetical protein
MSIATLKHGARVTDPETSHAAAERDPIQRERDRDRALFYLQAAYPDGLTDFELGELMQRQQTSAGKRRGELRDQGLVRPTEKRRPAPSGSAAIVWQYVPERERTPQPPAEEGKLF